jgi:short-subunit dehydrogenase
MFDTNIFAAVTVTHALAPLLISAKGTIINIGSVGGEFALVYSTMYNASKAALRAFSNTMRMKLMPLDVKVMAAITGIGCTQLFQNLLNKQPLLQSGSLNGLPRRSSRLLLVITQNLQEDGRELKEFARERWSG